MPYQIFGCVPARTRQFVPFVQGARSRFTDDEKIFLLCKDYISLLRLNKVWRTFPGYGKFRFAVL